MLVVTSGAIAIGCRVLGINRRRARLEMLQAAAACGQVQLMRAYQEALASNLPVLAWDQGEWLDPARPRYSDAPVAATSVPYFSEACGLRFKGGHEPSVVIAGKPRDLRKREVV